MIFMTPPTDCRNWKNVLQLIFLILIDNTNYRSLMYFWSTCLSQCLGKKQTIMRLQPAGSSPAGTSSRSHCVYCFCALLSHTSKNNSSLSCWITTLPDQSFVEFRSMGKSLLLQTLFFHFIFCLSVMVNCLCQFENCSEVATFLFWD